MKASDLFADEDELASLIESAASRARGAWEEQFISDMEDKFKLYGLGMFMSEKQEAILRRIAGVAAGARRGSKSAPPSEPPPAGSSLAVIDKSFLRQLTQLCHPDKHGQSPLSVDVTKRLNALRATI